MKKLTLVAVVSTVAALYSAQAFAQGASDCTCLTQAAGGSATIPVGSVISSQGSVQATSADNASLADARVGTLLRDQSTVVTGVDGTASVLVGRDCRLDIPASSQMVISRVEEQLCIRLTSDGALPVDTASAAAPATQIGTVSPIGGIHPMTVPLVVLAGSGIAYLLGDDGEGPSSR